VKGKIMPVDPKHIEEARALIYGKPPAKPAVRQTPVKTMSEAERQSRAKLTAKFALWDQMKALAAEFGEIDYSLAVEFVERGLTVDEARRELSARAAERGWSTALAGVQSPMH